MTKPDEIAPFFQLSVVYHMFLVPKTLWLDLWAISKYPIFDLIYPRSAIFGNVWGRNRAFFLVFWKFWIVRNCAGVKQLTNCTSDGRKVQRWNGNRLLPELCLVAISTDLSPHRQVWMLAKERAQPFSPTTLAPTRTTTQMSKTMESRKAYCTVFVTQPSHPNRTTCMYSCLFEHSINPISYSYIWQQSIFTNLPSIFLRYFLSMMLTLMMRIVLATVFCRFGFCHKAKLLFRLWAQGFVKIWSWSPGKILKLEFGLYFAVFCRGYEVESGLNKLLW